MHVVMGSNPGEVNLSLFHSAAILSFYIVQRTPLTKLCIFRRTIAMRHCMNLS
jgi:hypothetical protein